MIGLGRRWRQNAPGSGRTVQSAISMLPQNIQAAVTAALRDPEKLTRSLGMQSTERPDRGRAPAPPAEVPPYLFVVRSGQALTFNSLRGLAWARPDLLGVVFDRRWMGERRGQNRPGHAERRRAERRGPTPEAAWTKRGFVLASCALPSQPAPVPPVGGPPRLADSTVPAESVRAPARQAVPAPTGGVPHPAAPIERATMAGVPSRSRSVGRAVLGLGTLLLVGAVAAAGFDRWSREHSANVTESTPLGGPSPAFAPAPPGIVRAEPPPSVPRAPAPTLAPPSPEPLPTRVARRDPPPAVAQPVVPAEPVGAAGVAVDQCVTPTSPTVAIQSGEVLGALVGVKIDADSRPPRCLFVVERGDGTLWVVDSSRVEARAR